MSSKLHLKKIMSTIDNLDVLFTNLQTSFELSPEISKVLIIIGSTVISPKECYLINLPNFDPEADGISKRKSVQTMMRQLVSKDFFGKIKTIRPARIFFLCFAPRNADMKWFIPKASFKIPHRGQHIVLDFKCANLTTSVLEHFPSEDIEISGIEPFDVSCANLSVVDQTKEECSDPMKDCGFMGAGLGGKVFNDDSLVENVVNDMYSESVNLNYLHQHVTCDSDPDMVPMYDQDFIWFQAPVSIQGFMNKAKTSDGGIGWL